MRGRATNVASNEGLLGVVDSIQEAADGAGGLAAQSTPVEPGSLAARMLLEIARGVRGANADLADRLDTDQWQVSRAGRRFENSDSQRGSGRDD